MCIRLSKIICNVHFNYSMCLTINNDKSTGRTWQLGCHWQSWYRSGTTELFVNCSSCIIIFGVLWTKLEASASIKKLTGMSMSQSFFMRIYFIMNIACLLKLAINYWNSFNLPSQLMLLNQMQVPVYTAQISIFILSWSLPSDFADLQAETS